MPNKQRTIAYHTGFAKKHVFVQYPDVRQYKLRFAWKPRGSTRAAHHEGILDIPQLLSSLPSTSVLSSPRNIAQKLLQMQLPSSRNLSSGAKNV